MTKCIACKNNDISSDEIGLNKKMISKETNEFLCYDCLALKFKCSKDNLLFMVKRLKKLGCTLFVLDDDKGD